MKRSDSLRPLSEQHHHGLVAARRLRLAAAGGGTVALEAAVTAFLAAWAAEIRPHFRAEEAVLLPELARRLGPGDPLILRTLREHGALRRDAAELAAARGESRRELAAGIAAALHDHIRFEERELFPVVETALEGELLARLGKALEDRKA